MHNIEQSIIQQLEVLQDPKLIEECQRNLNRIQFEKYRIEQLRREYDAV